MSTENLNPDSLAPQDKEWEATMLSFIENSEAGVIDYHLDIRAID